MSLEKRTSAAKAVTHTCLYGTAEPVPFVRSSIGCCRVLLGLLQLSNAVAELQLQLVDLRLHLSAQLIMHIFNLLFDGRLFT
jgi:hypothetical protein